MQTDGTIVGQCILNQEVRVGTFVLCQLLIALIEIYTVTLNPGRNPSLILSIRLAVRKVELIVQLMVLALKTYHLEEVKISRTCCNNAVNDGITGQHIVYQQGVRS